ncbi:GNAT family N-acetyltransferase [Sulfitobacter pontiacus]|uniref:GNAT family N-acetyltransferase n=1 Tax=Sulfitobacter pontiacus TaxID=60137 RepID=UPI002E17C157
MLHRPSGSVRSANGTLSDLSLPSCSKTASRWRKKTRHAQNSAQSLADMREQSKKIVPLCPFAASEFRKHPEWADVLN